PTWQVGSASSRTSPVGRHVTPEVMTYVAGRFGFQPDVAGGQVRHAGGDDLRGQARHAGGDDLRGR
ncbi:MAG TPA: hypothetical protein GX400_00170, partial [Chloroflexi bacterium]|nr:hypothetical protein [Chloroflexota bacterium]